jgi:hypothetical protein
MVSLAPRRALRYAIHVDDPKLEEVARAYERVSMERQPGAVSGLERSGSAPGGDSYSETGALHPSR